MKPRLLLCLVTLFCMPHGSAGQEVGFPKAKPLIDLTFPDGWEIETKDGVLYAHPEEDAGFFIALAKSEATKPKDAAAGAKEEIEELFKNVKFDEPQMTEADGLHLMIVNAKGEDEDGKANINLCLIGKEGDDTILVMKCISSQEAFEKHGELGIKVINSITLHAEEPTLQTYSFPDEKDPSFAIDFPKDWKVDADETGAFIESANKQFTTTIIAIDVEHIMEAMESIGQSVTKRYESVVWNEGGKPTVKQNEETGMTVTVNDGIATHADGTKHRLGLYQYAKIGSKKFYVVNTWALESGLRDNARAIDAMLESIRHK